MSDDKAAAAYHPGDGAETRLDLDALTSVVNTLAISSGGCGHSRFEPDCPFCDDRMVVRRGRAALIALTAALAAERARADQAAAKVEAVEALRDKWMRDGEQPDLWIALNRTLSVDTGRCPSCRHAEHEGFECLNMASDNDCACTYGFRRGADQ